MPKFNWCNVTFCFDFNVRKISDLQRRKWETQIQSRWRFGKFYENSVPFTFIISQKFNQYNGVYPHNLVAWSKLHSLPPSHLRFFPTFHSWVVTSTPGRDRQESRQADRRLAPDTWERTDKGGRGVKLLYLSYLDPG